MGEGGQRVGVIELGVLVLCSEVDGGRDIGALDCN